MAPLEQSRLCGPPAGDAEVWAITAKPSKMIENRRVKFFITI